MFDYRLDYGEATARDYEGHVVPKRDGAAIEQVLTLPIRGAPYTIEPAKGDKGEAEFVQSVLMTPDQDGGMATPISELVGQITAGQVFRRRFFEKTSEGQRESDGRIIYARSPTVPPPRARPGTTTGPASRTGSGSRCGCSAEI